MNNLHHTQVARAYKDGDSRKAVMSFVHKKCKEYIATEGANDYWPVARFNRFRSHVTDAFIRELRHPQHKTFVDDPTGETAIRNIMKELAA